MTDLEKARVESRSPSPNRSNRRTSPRARGNSEPMTSLCSKTPSYVHWTPPSSVLFPTQARVSSNELVCFGPLTEDYLTGRGSRSSISRGFAVPRVGELWTWFICCCGRSECEVRFSDEGTNAVTGRVRQNRQAGQEVPSVGGLFTLPVRSGPALPLLVEGVDVRLERPDDWVADRDGVDVD